MKSVSFLVCFVGFLISEIVAVSSELRHDEIISRGKRNTESSSYFFYQQPAYPRDCKEVYDQCEGQSVDGVYLIKPDGFLEPFEVYCNNTIDGGGWTVIQRRVDGSVDFYRYWNDYKKGFGFLSREFWLGNDKISYLTNQKSYELRIDLNNQNGEPYFAKYNLFRISDEGTKYRLVGLGDYNSTSTVSYDAMAYGRNYPFSARDQENDNTPDRHCASHCMSGWWFGTGSYVRCGDAILTNLYIQGSTGCDSIRWRNLPGGDGLIEYTEMKIRPVQN